MTLTKENWENVLKQSESMLRDAQLSEIASTMMLNRAKQELGQIEDDAKQELRKGEKKGI